MLPEFWTVLGRAEPSLIPRSSANCLRFLLLSCGMVRKIRSLVFAPSFKMHHGVQQKGELQIRCRIWFACEEGSGWAFLFRLPAVLAGCIYGGMDTMRVCAFEPLSSYPRALWVSMSATCRISHRLRGRLCFAVRPFSVFSLVENRVPITAAGCCRNYIQMSAVLISSPLREGG